MRRREPPKAALAEMPDRLRRYHPAEWVTPAEPDAEFLAHFAAQAGTKGTLAEDWFLHRAVRARHVWRAERDAWLTEHGLTPLDWMRLEMGRRPIRPRS